MADEPAGVRRNALTAPSWTLLAHVDGRVTEPLLGALEDARVAAYAEPGDPPADRVYVDSARRDVAEAVVAAELPGLLAELAEPPRAEPDERDLFEQIVAGFDADSDLPVPPWPVDEDVDVARRMPEPARVRRPEPEDPDDEDGADIVEYDEGHYVPPPPPPLPPAHPVTRWAAVTVAAGLFVIVGLPLLGTEPSPSAQLLGVVAIIAGLATLIWRMRDAPPVDDGPDDGAVL